MLDHDGSFTIPFDISDVLGDSDMVATAADDANATSDSTSCAVQAAISGDGTATVQASTSGSGDQTTQANDSGDKNLHGSNSGSDMPSLRDIARATIFDDSETTQNKVSVNLKFVVMLYGTTFGIFYKSHF